MIYKLPSVGPKTVPYYDLITLLFVRSTLDIYNIHIYKYIFTMQIYISYITAHKAHLRFETVFYLFIYFRYVYHISRIPLFSKSCLRDMKPEKYTTEH